MSSPYDRLNSLRKRVDNLSSSKSGQQILKKSRQQLLPPAPTTTQLLPIQSTEPDSPALASFLQAASYNGSAGASLVNDPAAASKAPAVLGFTEGEKAVRQMSQYFDYDSYCQQAPDDPSRSKTKLSKKQIQSLKKKKAEKKIQKRLDWLYND